MAMIRIKATNVCKRYADTEVIKNFNIELNTGDCPGVFGTNGSGKSTLLRLIAGLTEPDSGTFEIRLSEKLVEFNQLPSIEAIVSPTVGIPAEMTLNNLKKMYDIMNRNSEQLQELSRYFGLSDFADRQFGSFSTGMLQRVRLITAFAKSPQILILDEGFSNLDKAGKQQLTSLLDKHRRELLCVMSSNSMDDLQICNRIINLNREY